MSSKPPCLGGHSQKLLQINIMPGCNVPPKMEANKNWRYPISCAPPPILLTFKKNKRGATSTSFHKLQASDLNWENDLDRLDFLETFRRIRLEGNFPRLHINMSKTEQLDTQSDWRCLKLNVQPINPFAIKTFFFKRRTPPKTNGWIPKKSWLGKGKSL